MNGTGLNEILNSSKAGKSQLYHYFGSKQNLIREVLHLYAEKVFQETDRFMTTIESLDEFEKLIDGITRLSQSDGHIVGCLAGSIAAELAPQEEVIRLDIVHIFERWKNLFSKGLVRLQAKSILDSQVNTEYLAEHFLIATQGAMLMAKTMKDTRVIDRDMRKAIQYLCSFATSSVPSATG